MARGRSEHVVQEAMKGDVDCGGLQALDPQLIPTGSQQQPPPVRPVTRGGIKAAAAEARKRRKARVELVFAIPSGQSLTLDPAVGQAEAGSSAALVPANARPERPKRGGRKATVPAPPPGRVPGSGSKGSGGSSVPRRVPLERPPRAVRSMAIARNRGSKRVAGAVQRSTAVMVDVSTADVRESSPEVLLPKDGGAVILGAKDAGDCQPHSDSSSRNELWETFPRIHYELGQQCLARLLRSEIHSVARVCRRWKQFLLSPEFYKLRRTLGVREDWVFIYGALTAHPDDNRWRVFQPGVEQWRVLPACPSDYVFESCDKESMVAGLNLLVLGQNQGGYVIYKFDTITSDWSTTPRMHCDRCMFGSAAFGKYAYFAGGSNRAVVLKSVERYDSEFNSWELLAEMNHQRKACSGFVMDGKFHVIGGHAGNVQEPDSSGEAYDPQTGEWTLIPNMWPLGFVPEATGSPPLVAVVSNQLYAVHSGQNTLMLYNKEANVWNMVCEVPHARKRDGWGLGFKAVGDELYVIGGGQSHGVGIHAYRPRSDGEDPWRLVTDWNVPTNGFIFNCAVMSG